MYLFTATKDGVSTRVMIACEVMAIAVTSKLRVMGYDVTDPKLATDKVARGLDEFARARILLESVTHITMH